MGSFGTGRLRSGVGQNQHQQNGNKSPDAFVMFVCSILSISQSLREISRRGKVVKMLILHLNLGRASDWRGIRPMEFALGRRARSNVAWRSGRKRVDGRDLCERRRRRRRATGKSGGDQVSRDNGQFGRRSERGRREIAETQLTFFFCHPRGQSDPAPLVPGRRWRAADEFASGRRTIALAARTRRQVSGAQREETGEALEIDIV